MSRNLLKDSVIYGFGDFIFKFIGFATFPIFAHLLTIEDFGVMALVTTLAGLVSIIQNLGINNSIQRFYWDLDTFDKDRPILVSTGLWIQLCWSSFITIVILITIYPLHEIIFQRYKIFWGILLIGLITNIPSLSLQYVQDTLRLHFSPWRFTLISACKNLLAVVFGLMSIVIFQLGLFGYFLGNFLALIFFIPLGLWFVKKDLSADFDWKNTKKIVRFGYPFVFAGLAYWVFSSMDRWMLGSLSNNTNVGLYSIAYKFASILFYINIAFGQAWSPAAIKIFADDKNYRTTFSRILSVWLFALTIIASVLCLFSYELLRIATPEAYWHAVNTINFLIAGMVFLGTTQITVLGISLEKKTHLLSTASWATALINFSLNLLLIPKFGAVGAGLATLCSYAVLTCMYLFWTQKLHPIHLEKKKLSLSLIILFSVMCSSTAFNTYEWSWSLIPVKLALIFILIGSAFLIKIFRFSDFKILFSRGNT